MTAGDNKLYNFYQRNTQMKALEVKTKRRSHVLNTTMNIIPYLFVVVLIFLYMNEHANNRQKIIDLELQKNQIQNTWVRSLNCTPCVRKNEIVENPNKIEHTSLPPVQKMHVSRTLPAKSKNENYYDEQYHKWQIPSNVFGALVKGDFLNFFVGEISGNTSTFPNSVLEFGSSVGYLLDAVVAHGPKYGVEIGDYARHMHITHFPHIHSLRSSEEAPYGIDFIYSHSVLEHVDSPVHELQKLKRLLSPTGVIFIHVKNEGMVESQFSWRPGDINNHIYTWNGLILGNLLHTAGLQVCKTASQFEAWHHVDAKTYKKNKCEWCMRNLKYGKEIKTQSVYAVAIREDSTNCRKVREALDSVLSCRRICM